MRKNSDPFEQAKRTMATLVRQPPKPDDQMKLSKQEQEPAKKKPAKRGASGGAP